MAARKTAKPPYVKALARIAAGLAKAPASKIHDHLDAAFELIAASGDVARTTTLVRWMYGRAPAPTNVVSVFSTSAIDGFCHAAGLGDVTHGQPVSEGWTDIESFTDRISTVATDLRSRLWGDCYSIELKDWRTLPPNDAFRDTHRWRSIQKLAREGDEKTALSEVNGFLLEGTPGKHMGDPLVAGLDLAFRHGGEAFVPAWLARHGSVIERSSFTISEALCLPEVATAIVKGLLRGTIGLTDSELEAAMNELDSALETAMATKPKTLDKTEKRRVGCNFSQVHLRPAAMSIAETAQVLFQEEGDVAKGMSLFATKVGIGTPAETAYVDAEISMGTKAKPKLDDAAQAVTFPLTVTGPLLLESIDGDDDDAPFIVPNGNYDVLARFLPKKTPKDFAGTGLRVFKLLLSFHPSGALSAPRTLILDES